VGERLRALLSPRVLQMPSPVGFGSLAGVEDGKSYKFVIILFLDIASFLVGQQDHSLDGGS